MNPASWRGNLKVLHECNDHAAGTSTAEHVDIDPRGASRIAPGLHVGRLKPRHPPAGHSHGARDGARVAIRRGGRVFCRTDRRERGGNGGADGISAESRVRGGDRLEHVDHCDGRAQDRGERSGGRVHRRSASHRAGTDGLVVCRCALLVLCAASVAVDGSVPGDCGERLWLRPHCAGRLRRDHDVVPEQRDLPRARGMRRLRCACCGCRTSSTSFSILA